MKKRDVNDVLDLGYVEFEKKKERQVLTIAKMSIGPMRANCI